MKFVNFVYFKNYPKKVTKYFSENEAQFPLTCAMLVSEKVYPNLKIMLIDLMLMSRTNNNKQLKHARSSSFFAFLSASPRV